VILGAQARGEFLRRCPEDFEPAALEFREPGGAAHEVERRTTLGAGFGQCERAVGKIERGEIGAHLLRNRRFPVEPAGDHEVQHHVEIVLHLEGDPFAQPPDGANGLADELRERRIYGSKQEGRIQPGFEQRLAQDPPLEGFDVNGDIRQLRHRWNLRARHVAVSSGRSGELIVSVHVTQIHQPELEDVMRKMPAFTKAPPETLERFAAATGGFDDLEPRTMFSYPSVFLNGNMLACVFQDRIMVRLSDADRTIFLTIPNTRLFEPSPGRAMREYVEAPRPDEMPLAELRGWIRRGIDYVAGLPKKTKAKPAKKAAGTRKASARAKAPKSAKKRVSARSKRTSAAKRAKKRR